MCGGEPTIPHLSDSAVSLRRSRLGAWAPVVVWAAVIFALSSLPGDGTDLSTWELLLRKLAHVTEYAILAALLCRALRRVVPAVVLAGLYAVTDEVHQTFVDGRLGTPRDVAIDLVGILVGAVLWQRPWRARR
jgi:VanZ family protein